MFNDDSKNLLAFVSAMELIVGLGLVVYFEVSLIKAFYMLFGYFSLAYVLGFLSGTYGLIGKFEVVLSIAIFCWYCYWLLFQDNVRLGFFMPMILACLIVLSRLIVGAKEK